MKLWGKAAVLALLAGLAAPAFAQTSEPAPSSSEAPVTPPPADDGTRVINGDPVTDGEAPWIGRMAADRKVTCGLLQSRIAQRGAAANFALRATNTSSARCLAAGADLQEVLSPDEKWIFTHQCGATYLGGGWLVTAAHCFKNAGSLPVAGSPTEALLFSAWQFSFGSNSATAKVPAYRANQIVVHAGYETVRVNPQTNDIGLSNDIALVHLENASALDRNPKVRAIQIARPGKGLGTEAAATVLMGWGSTTAQAWTEEGRKIDRLPEKLLKATLSIHDDCNEASPNPEARSYYARNPAPKGTICARGIAVGGKPTDSCHGDSGGPLIQANSGGTRSLASSDRAPGWYLVGIVSRGPGCGMPGASGLYTRVSSFADWIDRVRKGNWPRKTITRAP